MLIADIANGETDWADIFFLVALILFVISGVLRLRANAIDAAIVSFGLACVAFGLLVL